MELSNRLQAVVDLLDFHDAIADIGCDHGFVSIYLIQNKKAAYCIAMDVNKGPLERAREHILEKRLSTYIETRLSDGAKELRFTGKKGSERVLEVQAAIIAGMGGRLTIKIIEDSLEKFLAMKEFVLQPQSEIGRVRRYLEEIGCSIVKEDMVLEDGKYYPMMKAAAASGDILRKYHKEDEKELFYQYGEYLLRSRNPVLGRFLMKEKALYEDLWNCLWQNKTEKSRERKKEVEEKLRIIEQGLEWFLDEM